MNKNVFKLRQGKRRRGKPLACPYSDSCFTCPLRDCNAERPYNEILSDDLYLELMEYRK